MNPVASHVTAVAERIRLGICLVHAVPGAAATVTTTNGDRLLVARHRSDATLDPCQARAALVAPVRSGVPHLADVLIGIDVVGGLVDIGGGLYQRNHPAGEDERWFVTPLHPHRVVAIAATCPIDVPDGSVDVRVCADPLLGACAVRVAAAAGFGYRLDEVAMWLHANCLVSELTDTCAQDASVRPRP